EAWVDLDLVCDRGDGGPLDPSAFTHGWARIAASVGLDGVRLHDIRHAVATAYARSGARPSVTAAILGHANPGFTSKVYEHPDEAMLREAAEAAAKLDALDQ
ncbi:MAG TPA: tyrosine-type recombinase/integrase, partial [Acidimicrobiia bacterium]|nr:tyrosine-type recombinase/integrase [Acidimicrobiia bacterium]